MVVWDDLLDLASAFVKFLSQVYCFTVMLSFRLYYSLKPKVSVPKVKNPILLKTATALAQEIREGKTTSVGIVNAVIERIKEVQPIINAVTEYCFEEALQAAANCDLQLENMNPDERNQLAENKPLFGIPFTVKDGIQVKGKKLTWGNPVMKDVISPESAEAIDIMFESGAILICITLVPENCVWVEGNNPIHGYANNPYDNRRMVGGSSSGVGALVSASGLQLGVGSDIGGSIRIPSAMNGIFGLKPTSKVIPIARYTSAQVYNPYLFEFLLIGPMTRTVEDLTLLYKVLGGEKALDVLRQKENFTIQKIFVVQPERNWVPSPEKQQRKAVERAVNFLKSNMNSVALDLNLSKWGEDALKCAHAKASLKKGYGGFREGFEALNGGPYYMCIEFLKYISGKSKHSLSGCFAYVNDPLPEDVEERDQRIKILEEHRREAELLIGNDSIIVLPTWPHVAPFHDQSVFHMKTFHVYTIIFNMVDLPAITVPMGLNSEGLPLSIQIVGPKGSDGLLIDIASMLEKQFGGWAQP